MRKNIVLAVAASLVALSVGAVLKFRPATPTSGVREANAQEILAHVKDLKASVTLVNFWASWCEPCKEEFPSLLELKKELEPRGLGVVFVSVDDTGDLPAAEAFLKTQNVNFPTFYKGSQSLNFVADIFPKWSGAVPVTLLLGPDLQVLDAWEGDTSLKELHERVTKHLKGT